MHPELLQRSPLFARLAPEGLRVLATAMTTREVPWGGPVWLEGTRADEMALVLTGALVAKVGVQEVGTVRAGELVGEAGVFFGDPRVASVHATESTVLAVLSHNALLSIAEVQPDVYLTLLNRALEATARRVQDAGKRVALLGNGGVEPPVRKPPSMFTRMLRVAAAGEPDTPVVPVLRRMPVLSQAAPATLARIATALHPRPLHVDEALLLEGEQGETAFVIGDGEVEVVRAVRGGKARRLATLSAGAVMGTGALVLGERRNASVRVTKAGWAWEMERAEHAALDGAAGRAWRELLLVSLRYQLSEVTTALADLQGGTSSADRARLRAAAERLAGVQTEAADDPWSFFGKPMP